MHGRERVALQRESLPLPQLRGQRIRDVEHERKRGVDDPPHGRDGNLLRGRIDGREVGRRARLVADVVGARLEAVAAELPAQPDLGARLEPVNEPRLVEPRDTDRGGVVGDPGDDARSPPAAHRTLLDVEHAAGDHNLLALAKGGDRHLVGGRLVAPRPVLEHVAHRCEPKLAELPLRRRGDARQGVEREVEALRPQSSRRRRPGPGLVQTCEDRLSTGGCHRLRHRAPGVSRPDRTTADRLGLRIPAGPALARRPRRERIQADDLPTLPAEANDGPSAGRAAKGVGRAVEEVQEGEGAAVAPQPDDGRGGRLVVVADEARAVEEPDPLVVTVSSTAIAVERVDVEAFAGDPHRVVPHTALVAVVGDVALRRLEVTGSSGRRDGRGEADDDERQNKSASHPWAYTSSWNQKRASVPGPACAPMTAPSVTTSSSSA